MTLRTLKVVKVHFLCRCHWFDILSSNAMQFWGALCKPTLSHQLLQHSIFAYCPLLTTTVFWSYAMAQYSSFLSRHTLLFKSLGTVGFVLKEIRIFVQQGHVTFIKSRVKDISVSNKCCSCKLSIIKVSKKMHLTFHKIFSSTYIFSIDSK